MKNIFFSKEFREKFKKADYDENYFKDIIRKFYEVDANLIIQAQKELPTITEWYEELINFNATIKFREFLINEMGLKRITKKYPALKELKEKLVEDKFLFNYKTEGIYKNVLSNLQKLLNKAYENYKKTLLENKQIDFDTIIEYANHIIDKKKLKYKYVMVDEFQDTNLIQ